MTCLRIENNNFCCNYNKYHVQIQTKKLLIHWNLQQLCDNIGLKLTLDYFTFSQPPLAVTSQYNRQRSTSLPSMVGIFLNGVLKKKEIQLMIRSINVRHYSILLAIISFYIFRHNREFVQQFTSQKCDYLYNCLALFCY